MRLEVLQQLRVGEGRWQILRVAFEDTTVAAKVYDPLFFDSEDDDPFESAHRSFSHEVSAYTLLRGSGSTPEFYGSFRAKVDRRFVYFVLIEFFPLGSLRTFAFSGSLPEDKETRESLASSAIKTETFIVQNFGIMHVDFKCRNIFPRRDGSVVLGDWERWRKWEPPGKPLSPIVRLREMPREFVELGILQGDWKSWMEATFMGPDYAEVTADELKEFHELTEPLTKLKTEASPQQVWREERPSKRGT